MRRILLLFGIVVLASCEKDVDFKLNEKPDVLVVDASIENDRPPLVVLTRSLNYFSQISPEILANMFVHDAEILISNGTLTQKLKEYVVDQNAFLKIYYYSIDSSNMASSFLGNVNTSYSLVIKTGGKEYTAQTTI
ncbi:MAG TPA: DUF4249 family protein, partial [Chitinophagaceae bacterium]|nr:DUF4249 family protein [Chitinophagaceae bacterium]